MDAPRDSILLDSKGSLCNEGFMRWRPACEKEVAVHHKLSHPGTRLDSCEDALVQRLVSRTSSLLLGECHGTICVAPCRQTAGSETWDTDVK